MTLNGSALVLGGLGGIGLEIVKHLIKAGIEKIAVIDLPENASETLLKAVEGIAFIYRSSRVDDELALKATMGDISKEFGGLDIVVNSVGIIQEAEQEKMISVNFTGVVNSTLCAIDLMRVDRGGNGGFIVNISSISGLGTENFFWIPTYAGTKHGVLGFTKSLANPKFHHLTGISFITICPGLTQTELGKHVISHHPFPEMMEECRRQISLFPRQLAPIVGQCVAEAVIDGENGSVWQVENNRIEKISIKPYERIIV